MTDVIKNSTMGDNASPSSGKLETRSDMMRKSSYVVSNYYLWYTTLKLWLNQVSSTLKFGPAHSILSQGYLSYMS